MKSCVGYIRISSQTNVDGDSIARQKQAIETFAKRQNLSIVRWFEDLAVSGADQLDQRKGFVELLQYMNSNGAKTILVEEVKRLIRKPRGKKTMSLRKVSAELFRLGYKTSLGKPYSATQIKRINV